jgi:ABC-type multidrug transport system fused ATPase/permease subunit
MRQFFGGFKVLSPKAKLRLFVLIPVVLVGVFLETLSVGMVIPALGVLMSENYLESIPHVSQVLEKFGNPSHDSLIIFGLVALAGSYLVKNLYLFFQIQMQGTFVYGAQREITYQLFCKYLNQSFSFHLNTSSAQLIRNLTTEVLSYCNFFLMPVINLVTEILVITAILGLILFIEPQGALILIFALGFLVYFFVKASRETVTSWGANRLAAEEGKLRHLQQGFRGIKEILLSQKKEYFLSRFQIHNKLSGLMNKKEYIFQYVPKLGVEVIAISSLVGMCLFLILQGNSHQQVTNMLGLMATAGFRLIPSFSRVLNNLQSIHYGWASVTALQTDTDTMNSSDGNYIETSLQNPLEDSTVPCVFEQHLAFSKVSFSYGSKKNLVLSSINMAIEKGKCIGVKGESGAGKSTLVNLILGLVEPTEGEILVDSVKLNSSNLLQWQAKIGYVPQDIYLLDDTLNRNIAFGLNDQEVNKDRVLSVLKLAQLEALLNHSPSGEEFTVGENGSKLSGGQKQRIGIARALYHDPEVLILDEATSALDPEKEKQVLLSLKPMLGNKTILIIAHRDSALELCSDVYQIENGRIFKTIE